MNPFEAIGRYLNLRGVLLSISTQERLYLQGDSIEGSIVLQGGEYDQRVRSLHLTLLEFWVVQSGKHRHTKTKNHETRRLSEQFLIRAGEPREFPFTISLPSNCRLSRPDCGWWLMAALDIQKTRKIRQKHPIDVQPAGELIGLIKALEKGPQLRENPKKRLWNPKTGEVRIHLTPPESLRGELDSIRVYGRRDGDQLVGRFVFNLQEKTLLDYARAAVGQDRISVAFRFPRSRLFLPDGSLDPVGINEEFARALEQALTQRQE
jgi:sporulation-control protein spo0M